MACSALTLENLENNFYKQGFARFSASDFTALGLNQEQIADLQSIGKTEESHVIFLQSTLAQSGIQPVQPCEYNFGFTDAAGMIATAGILEQIGVSAYLGAAPLVADKGLLGKAATIATIEGHHEGVIRAFSGLQAVPQPFDSPLGPRAVFSLAAPFIKSCPDGSNLNIQPFPALSMEPGQTALSVGSMVRVKAEGSTASAAATKCAFTSGGVSLSGTVFSDFNEGTGCVVPQGVAGVTYLFLSSTEPSDGILTDDITVGGPMVLSL